MRRTGHGRALQEHYDEDVVPALKKEFAYKNALQVPKLEKIVINMGVGEAVKNARRSRRPWPS